MESAYRFTDRHGGVSSAPYASLNLGDHVGDDAAAVAENRTRATASLGDLPIVWMRQVHGRTVAVVDAPSDQPIPDTDALVTTTAGLTLGVLVADCVPVLIDAPGVAAVAHAGRKGLQLGVVPAVLEVLVDLGHAPEALTARLGPSACGACYEVPEAMRAEVAAVAPAAASTTRAGTAGLDIRAGLAEQLRSAGVRQVEVSSICTIESADHFSYRRDGTTGRSAGLLRCSPGLR
ncbi:MAG: purine-nucleoside/S-methyl-5-thioadenosine phosphorylase / adenosine deaminase [Frankiaceae bacterium]|nr:purine-nucleoside/S-methyl-5-thioadenosine phosphorylase / adenosine deaminase [Frankiaceae bacterium]